MIEKNIKNENINKNDNLYMDADLIYNSSFFSEFCEIKVKYHDKDIENFGIEYSPNGDWIDLRSAEDVELNAGDFKIISLGISIRLPAGYEAIIAPRSSLFKNHGIIMTNSIGVIDNSYCGDDDIWGMPIYATRNTRIEKGERICQFRLIYNQQRFNIKTVDTLGEKSRGGFGSTGKK